MAEHYVAHFSPKDRPEQPPHDYADHVRAVQRAGLACAEAMLAYARLPQARITGYVKSLTNALVLHDIGKLTEGNQAVLRGEQAGSLPYDHVDAGVAVCKAVDDLLAAWLVRAHHAPGLASVADENKLGRRLGKENLLRGKRHDRDGVDTQSIQEHLALIQETDELAGGLLSIHATIFGKKLEKHSTPKPDDALMMRLLLSCLVDADHGDTANYYLGGDDDAISVTCKWQERLDKLQTVVGNMQGRDKDRQKLREELFQQCLSDTSSEAITTCAAPVGLGKTTAVTANLLKKASLHGLRRIFVIAPFTNVISQTAERLRDYLVLEGEDPFAVVAEHHHWAEFSRRELRQYAQRWQAPVVVTTAVQFFETLASASPTNLRKLHALPGSAVFVDEAHACVPPKLMRQSWFWMRRLAENWSCHFVLASGSLINFWQEPHIVGDELVTRLPGIFKDSFYQKAQRAERKRVHFKRLSQGKAIGKQRLLEAIDSQEIKGSRLVILNTVQSAAVIAQALQLKLQPDLSDDCPLSERIVLHISTALTPADRERIIGELMARQKAESRWKNRNWYLVATSCVEAGVDLDFDTGFRERCSVTSFLQTAGRINREALNPGSVLYDFALKTGDDDGLLAHPAFKDAIAVFDKLWERLVDAEKNLDALSTTALICEIQRAEEMNTSRLDKNEQNCNFPQVQKDFKLIASNTITAVVSDEIYDKLMKNIPLHYRDLQQNSVQIWRNKIEKFGMTPIDQAAQLYKWNYRYDANFLGYMKDLDKMVSTAGWVQ